MRLVNLTPNKRGETKMQRWVRACKKHRNEYGYTKEFLDRVPTTLKRTLVPYRPMNGEYVENDMTDFTGVYISLGYYGNEPINKLANTTVLENLVDYGNVDNASQAIRSFTETMKLWASIHGDHYLRGNYVIVMHPIRRDRVYSWEEAIGTYRWHKNGGYSGKANVCCEYFLEEPDEKLKLVYSYQVFRVV